MNKKEPSLLQKTYIQKSRLFLLPLTGMTKNKHFSPTNTYISAPDLISSEYPEGIGFIDEILIVAYSKEYKIRQDNILSQVQANFKNISIEETGWERYESVIISNRRFISVHETDDEFLYTFDFSDWHNDWNLFIKGRYTLISSKAKQIIKDYQWTALKPVEQKKLYCYLYSNEDLSCFEDFADDLGYPVEELKQVRELCSKPDLRLETYKIPKKKQLDDIKI